VEPCVEPVAIAEPAYVPPRSLERVLHRVLGRVRVAQNPCGYREEAAVGGGRERIERGVVAVLSTLNEVGGHADPQLQREPLPRLVSMAFPSRESFSPQLPHGRSEARRHWTLLVPPHRVTAQPAASASHKAGVGA
jgi:hypothetical protein